ncbi:hypothetical protein C8A05DRAFT_17601, partial [Staphylotrichum tortipilum]
ICGEECPQTLCQLCCAQKDARVDLMEFKSYGEIDLDETPIAVLGCGHFCTGETLDGLVGMNNVYTTDKFGNFNDLQGLSGQLTTIPTCPDCRVPIRQFATRRYNRVINKAVLDETSKRFLIHGSEQLKELEKRVAEAEKDLTLSRPAKQQTLENLVKEVSKLRRTMRAEHQPVKKLFDAAVTLHRESDPLSQGLANLSLTPVPPILPNPVHDQQITLGALGLQLRINETIFRDSLTLWANWNVESHLATHRDIIRQTTRYLAECSSFITSTTTTAKLPRLAIPAILSHARTTQLYLYYRRTLTPGIIAPATTPNPPPQPEQTTEEPEKAEEPDHLQTARDNLTLALELITTFPNGEAYRAEIESTARLFEGPRYETVTPEEIAAIKRAMVGGRDGMATHSGHWYTCRNGHPFAIGECGMPMEQARCPECGAAIGGQHHTLLGDNQQDQRMEAV